MNSLQHLLNQITPEIYGNLKTAVETGKWPNGAALTQEQKELCLEAMIVWEKDNLPEDERTGYIPSKKHTHCGSQQGEIADDTVQPLNLH